MSTDHLLEDTKRKTVAPAATTAATTATGTAEASTGGAKDIVEPLAEVIPPTFYARTLVLCFDGTGDSFDDDNSNVVQLFSTLAKDDRSQQMVYYQTGIGTYDSHEVANPVTAKFAGIADMMVARSLAFHVMDGYTFIMQNYEAGDKICLFGFSRGAYTARAVAGMLHKVGLLPADNCQQVPFAYSMFMKTDEKGWKQSTAFKRAFCMDVDIEFVGVWDTVDSVGIIPRRLPFTASNSVIKTFRHAVALDERRAKFQPNLYNRATEEEKELGTKKGEMPKAGARHVMNKQDTSKEAKYDLARISGHHHQETDVLEVWFSGCHADVGGGSVDNDTRHSLARISLRWMIRQCFLTKTGIRFHSELLKRIGLDPSSLYPIVKPRPPALPANTPLPPLPHAPGSLTEEQEDLADALSPIYDQLEIKKMWWLLELIPFSRRVQREDNSWKVVRIPNLGRGRNVRHLKEPISIHRTVFAREEVTPGGKKYSPRAQVPVNALEGTSVMKQVD